MLVSSLSAHSSVLIATVVGASTLALLPLYVAWRRRKNPAERERRRRLKVNAAGRITDGTVVDFHLTQGETEEEAGGLIHYVYEIGGVEYAAAQDVSSLLDRVGGDPSSLVGTVNVKYHPQNPYNSIVICESWSGLRTPSAQQPVS